MAESPLPHGFVFPPTADALPSEDGIPLETPRHQLQMFLLVLTLKRHLARARPDSFVGGNMFVYYSLLQTRRNDFRGPDVFAVVGGVEQRARPSWVVWEENGRSPDVVIELTSPSTAEEDRGPKKHVYAQLMRVPEYFIFDPATNVLEGYRLDLDASVYQPMVPDAAGRLASHRLDLELAVAAGTWAGEPGPWLRFHLPGGEPLPLPEEELLRELRAREEAERAREEAERAREEAERAREEAERAREEAERAREEERGARLRAEAELTRVRDELARRG